MGSLLIVRHAQASFLADNYDKLSAMGEEQSRLLGTYWTTRNLRFDRVCAGPRVRQSHTAAIVSETYRLAGQSFPEVHRLPAFDEYPAEAVMERGLPILLQSDQRARDLHAAFTGADQDIRRAAFQRLFEYLLAEWARGEIPLDGVETWAAFCSRVNSGLDQFLAAGERSERTAIFTSAGPTAVALERALQISSEQTLQMSWMPRNCSWSEFFYTAEKFTLSSFNCSPHLFEPSHFTYR